MELLLGQERCLPLEDHTLHRVRDQPLLSILVALDINFKPGSNFAFLMRVGVRERNSKIPGTKEWDKGIFFFNSR